METASTCSCCDAVDCETAFHACLAADYSDARHGIVHHLVVPTYALQHGWYTDEATATVVDFVLAHLDRPPTDHDRRYIRDATDGPVRVRARTPRRLAPEWDLNIADVNTDSPAEYVTTVRRWAASVARTLSHIGRAAGGDLLPDDWDAPYASTPPWDIGRPQTPFIELADAGHLNGVVLELGCGTGEHTLLAARHALRATGVDLAPTAITKARTKAQQRGIDARFLVLDALTVDRLGETFDVVIDCGFFHVLSDEDRRTLADVLRRVMAPGATYHLLCFSDKVPGDAGPRRIHQNEIRTTFADGFAVDSITESSIDATFLDVPVPAWLATITRRA